MTKVIKSIGLVCLGHWLLLLGLTLAQGSDWFDRHIAQRARVVIVRDPQSISTFNPRSDKIRDMIDRGVTSLTGKAALADAWRTLISTQDIVGIKVLSAPGGTSGTRPSVAAALVESLLASGFSSKRIVVWDKHVADLRLAGFSALSERYKIQLAGSADEGFDEKAYYDKAFLGKLVWGDFEFGKKGEGVGRKSYLSKLLAQKLTKIINVTPLLNHNVAGVSGNLFGLTFGSVDNTIRFEFNPEQMATAIPEIYALEQLGDRVALNIVDALICQYQGEERTLLHYATMLGELRFSTDPVALDVLSIQELNRQREIARIPNLSTNLQIYINASLLELGVSDPRRMDVTRIP